jgi:predicted helicase
MIKFIHPKVKVLLDTIPEVKDCKVYNDFHKLILKASAQFNDEGTIKKFKGDMFEIFAEFLINKFEPIIGVKHYVPIITEDYGTDGSGIASNDSGIVAVQSKFRSNPADKLTFHDLSTFFSNAAFVHGVSNKSNLLIISTTYELCYTVSKGIGGDPRHVNLNQIEAIVNNININFFKDFYESLIVSLPEAVDRKINYELWDHQKDALDKITTLLKDTNHSRSQIIIPTGGGKTDIERESINISIDSGGMIHIIMAPRISLINQILNNMWDRKTRKWNKLLIRSGADDRVQFYTDEDYIDTDVVATTNVDEIIYFISKSLSYNTPINLFSTYHSADKIGKALQTIGREADICIGDEAHNMVYEGFNSLLSPEIIPAKKWLFFTATRIVSDALFGTGMNNKKLFGEIIYSIQPKELIKAGIIVPPRIHGMHYDGNADDVKYSAALIRGAIEKQLTDNKHKELRLIVACRSVKEAHELSTGLKHLLPKFYIAAISSNLQLMNKEHDKKDRKTILREFAEAQFAILLHYSILSEGIDIPGTTAILPLRYLSPVSSVQFTGRPLRVLKSDRQKLLEGRIIPGISDGWTKPFGDIILPYNRKDDNSINSVYAYINNLRRGGFDIDVDHISVKVEQSNDYDNKSDIIDLFPAEKSAVIEFENQIIERIELGIEHDIEAEERALIRQSDSVMRLFER